MNEKLKQEKEILLKRISEIDTELQKPTRTPEQFFIEVINSITSIKKDVKKYPDITVFLAGNKIVFEIEKSTLWCRYDRFWSVFYTEFSYNYTQTQGFIKNQMEEHFKTNQWQNVFLHPNWRLKTKLKK